LQRRSRITRRGIASVACALVAAPLLVVPSNPAAGIGPSPEGPVAQIGRDIADANTPSLSADGRSIVFGGTLGERRSVFRTDRETDTTIELSPVPEGIETGDTIHARLSPDGCVVVAVTEIPFDLFRDDDKDERWDVYRLVLPECGGQPNAWELVSVDERTGVAVDGVFVDSPPAMSGSGGVIAYVHQARNAPPGVGTISVIDLTAPPDDPVRTQQVAGFPVESPNREFLYHGARQPALSQNGRHLAFVSDATASEPLPGWGSGPEAGGYATSQVYVWDRGLADQRRAVYLVSGRGGMPSAAGADSPAMSEDGRIIVFTSRDRTLAPAVLPECTPTCPSQVYRYDRDTDGNGIFDEPPRGRPLTIVSAVDAGTVEIGAPVAGDASSWSPAVNADGSQIAFVTDAVNLLPSRRSGGGSELDGDLLVAEFHLGQIRRVLDGPNLTAVPGAHGRPALSKTGQVIAFDTAATGRLRGNGARRVTNGPERGIVTVEVTPELSLAELDFGTVLLGYDSAELYATVLNSGPAAFEPTEVVTSSNFRVTGGSCKRGVIVAAGTSCSVNLVFAPTAASGYAGTLTVSGDGDDAPSVTTSLRGAAGDPTLELKPGGADLPGGVVGGVGGKVAIDVENIGFLPTSISRIDLGGAEPGDFVILEESCLDRALNPDATCTVEVEFRPTAAGYRSALVLVTTSRGQYSAAVLGGFARYEPTFAVDDEVTPRPGGAIGVGGDGFPAGGKVSIGFDDGSPPFASVKANGAGSFLEVIDLPVRVRIGERRLVATSSGNAVAATTIDVERRQTVEQPQLPGFGW
jgi:hypothetical protein